MKKKNDKGFTLIEVILVLALIGAIAGVIIPNLTISVDSQVSTSIRNLTAQIRAAYDDAVFSGRLTRMILDIKTGEYWVEQAPVGYEGRPPILDTGSDSDILAKRDRRKDLLKSLDDEAKNNSDRQMLSSTANDTKYYSLRSIPVVQRRVLRPIEWREINDAVTYRQKLSGQVVFAEVLTGLTNKKYLYSELFSNVDKSNKAYAYIYFLPNGTATPISIKLAIQQNKNSASINNEGPKFTINLNTLTGESNLLEGFQNANFTLSNK